MASLRRAENCVRRSRRRGPHIAREPLDLYKLILDDIGKTATLGATRFAQFLERDLEAFDQSPLAFGSRL